MSRAWRQQQLTIQAHRSSFSIVLPLHLSSGGLEHVSCWLIVALFGNISHLHTAVGHVATHAVVVARLITLGKDHGPHPFMVQLRSLDNHKPLAGSYVGLSCNYFNSSVTRY